MLFVFLCFFLGGVRSGEPGTAEERGDEALEGLIDCASEETLRFFGERDSALEGLEGLDGLDDLETPLLIGAEEGGPAPAVGGGSRASEAAPLPFCSAVALSKRARMSAVIASCLME